ncbi:MAG: glycosyltransferase [Lentisphaeria bacterium]|nr:glycosyltransferase [Lentisphaeria bacterium]
MFRDAFRDADIIVPVNHTRFPAEEILEENQLLPLHDVFERFRCSPLANGKLFKKSFLLDCLDKKTFDWIHSPCPDLFLMLFSSARACIARTPYVYDRETYLWFVGQYKNAAGWLSGLADLPVDEKYLFRSRILQYEDYLIDSADKLNLSEAEKQQYFSLLSIVHNAETVNPEKLRKLKLSGTEFQPKPVRSLAVFCAALRAGGGERCASLLLKYFATIPDLKVYLFQSKESAPGDYPCPENVEIIVLPKTFYERHIRLPDLLQKRGVDTCLFFDHYLIDFYYDILAAHQLGIRTIAMEHNTFSYLLYSGDIELMQLRQAIYPVTDVLTCLSRSDEYMWIEQGIRARYMPNPLTFDSSKRAPFMERKAKNLIFIARMVPAKGVMDAIKVVEILRNTHPEVKLFMLGRFIDPDFEQEMKDYVKTHRLDDNIEFTGFTSELDKYISQASVYLLPSAVEGWCLTALETRSFGLPAVAYEMPYLETLKNEYGTITVPQGDYKAMAAEVNILLNDFQLLNKWARKAYDSLRHFDNPVVFGRWNALFRWLETGTEPAELTVPAWTAEEKLAMLQIQNQEIVAAAAAALNLPSTRKRILNREMSALRYDSVFFNSCLRVYFHLRHKIEDGSSLRGLSLLFRIFCWLKRIYRLFKPWQDREQKL